MSLKAKVIMIIQVHRNRPLVCYLKSQTELELHPHIVIDFVIVCLLKTAQHCIWGEELRAKQQVGLRAKSQTTTVTRILSFFISV
jgi:hypothetical protein